VKYLPDFLPPVSLETVAELAIAALAVLIVLRLLAGPAATISRRAGLYVLRAVILATVLALLFNPVRVQELPGSIDAPDIFYLLDASSSMAMGTGTTRWDDVTGMIKEASDKAGDRSHARLNLFRFGQKLAAIEPSQIGMGSPAVPSNATSASAAGTAAKSKTPPPAKPADSDTQLAAALRQLSSRFGRSVPASIVLFSDGQARDAGDVEKIAGYFSRLKVPIHVVPVGDTTRGGDVAIVGVVAPDRVRRFSQVDVQVFLRSYGYEGLNARLVLSSLGENGMQHEITSTPITLRKGIQSVPLAFQSDAQMRKLEVSITPQKDEISVNNNRFPVDIGIDRTKIRVLYIEGNVTRMQQVLRGDRYEMRGAFSDLQDALSEDPDIECVVLMAFPGSTDLRRVAGASTAVDRGFPDTVAELSAFDCIVLSNVSENAISEKHQKWIDNWVNQRGGGLCMVGGQFSFGSGGWGGSVIEQILPVVLPEAGEDFEAGDPLAVLPSLTGRVHPIWHIVNDEKQNREILRSFPPFSAGNRLPRAKPNISTVLATATRGQATDIPAITVGHYGKGRSLALAGGITEPWSGEFTRWGQNDHRYYAKFWRNAVYWLTESSSIGRRRLIASTDKKSYRPGDSISLSALAYDEGANRTRDYRVVAMIEPAASTTDLISDDSPVRWPDGMQRTSGQEGPFIAWGEEFEVAKGPGKEGYDIQLPIAEALSAANQALRIELTAYEDLTQVDSTSLNIQVLDDPFELQNPFPNHELLSRIASVSGGKVLTNADALARELEAIPVKVGPSTTRTTPLWSRWWLLLLLLGLLSAEWIWRRSIGLA
jgi:uncharacterized membrane protein